MCNKCKDVITFKMDGVQIILNFNFTFSKKKYSEVAGQYNLIDPNHQRDFVHFLNNIIKKSYLYYSSNPRIELKIKKIGSFRKHVGYRGYIFEPLYYRGINKP